MFKRNRIRYPNRVSSVNLYVNGVIQPNWLYQVRGGKLIFRSADPPPAGVPIMLQFVRFVRTSNKVGSRAKAKTAAGRRNAGRRNISPTRKRQKGKGGEPMPASLIKMFITAVATQPTLTGGSVATTVDPTGTQYVALASTGTLAGGTLTILATAFTDDDGTAVTAFPDNVGYYNLYVNGVLQQAGLSTISTSQIAITDAADIAGSAPIVVQFVASTADSTLTNPTVSIPDITVNT